MSMWVRNVRLVRGRDQGRRLLHFWEVAREAGECGCTERDRALRFRVSLFNTQLNDSPMVVDQTDASKRGLLSFQSYANHLTVNG